MIEYEEQARELFQAISTFRRIKGKVNITGDLCMSEMAVFGALMKLSEETQQEGEPLPMSHLVQEVDISKSALSQIINKLENKGLVERIFSKEDRRATYLIFTDKGSEIYHREHDEMVTTLNTIVKQMGVEDTKTFIDLLKRLHGIIEDLPKNQQQGDNKKCQDCSNT